MTDAAHAFLAPSSAHRWRRCPASPTLEAQFPEQQDKAAALDGTAAHWVMEMMLKQMPVAVGLVAPNGICVTAEMYEAAELLFDNVVATLGAHWFHKIEVEVPVTIPRVHSTANWGTPDVVAWDGTTLYIWDFKFGHDYVEVFENDQLIDYVAGLLSRANERAHAARVTATSESAVDIVMRIVQPRSYHRDGPVREWRIIATGLRDYVFQLSMAAEEATSTDPRAKPDPIACEHCRARHACVALQKAVYKCIDIAEAATVAEMTPAALGLELRKLHDASALIDARKSGLEQQVESMMRAGIRVPHWVLRPGASRTVWNKSDAEVLLLGDIFGVDLAKPVEPMTPTQARKAGLAPDVVAAYSFAPHGAMKVALDDGSDARKTFCNKA